MPVRVCMSEKLAQVHLSVRRANEELSFVCLAGLLDEVAACRLQQQLARSDVPLADLFLDVGVQPSASDVRQRESGTAEHPCFPHFDGNALVPIEAGFEGFAAFRESDGDHRISEVSAVTGA